MLTATGLLPALLDHDTSVCLAYYDLVFQLAVCGCDADRRISLILGAEGLTLKAVESSRCIHDDHGVGADRVDTAERDTICSVNVHVCRNRTAAGRPLHDL